MGVDKACNATEPLAEVALYRQHIPVSFNTMAPVAIIEICQGGRGEHDLRNLWPCTMAIFFFD